MMVSCKAVGPGVSTGDEAGGGVDEESGAGVDMVMGSLVVDRTEVDSSAKDTNSVGGNCDALYSSFVAFDLDRSKINVKQTSEAIVPVPRPKDD
jgi:hypothetical protein